MYSDVEKAFDNGMRYAWNMVGDLFNMTPTERIDALGYSEVNEIVWDADPVEIKQKLLDWKAEQIFEEEHMEDYKTRMVYEYNELKERHDKLHKMLVKYEAGTLDFEPTCPIEMLKEQADVMRHYMTILEVRAAIEGVDLDLPNFE